MECISRGELDQAYEYDAVGQHPNSAIALNIMPEARDWLRTTDLDKWLSGVSGVGLVHFEFPEDELYPCLPVFHEDSLIFPLTGMSNTTVSEVKLAVDMGAKITLYQGCFYNTGTTVLTEYLSSLQEIRNSSDDDAYRELLKLLSNSIIGKFFQKNWGVDLNKVQKYAKANKIPLEEAMHIKGKFFKTDTATIGSCFYPEWYSLILGYARATISKQARDNQAIIISSDAFSTAKELPTEYTEADITYKLKASGSYVGYRARFYRIGDKLAHHAVHNKEVSKDVLEYFHHSGVFLYKHRRMAHLKESWRIHVPFGANIERNMQVFLGYDNKRRLLENGDTVPWRSVDERGLAIHTPKDQLRLL